jgi:AhpD family alkylhydroperoxidase
MSKSYKDVTARISKNVVGAIAKTNPDIMKGFQALSGAAMKDGALDEKTKEFIALAIGVAQHCDGCIGFHVKKLVQLGATREEIIETLGVNVYMGGGPGLMYAAEAMHAYEEFTA